MKTKLELVPLSEVARAAGVAAPTAKRRLDAQGIVADAVLIAGAKRPPSPLFLLTRTKTLLNAIATAPEPIA